MTSRRLVAAVILLARGTTCLESLDLFVFEPCSDIPSRELTEAITSGHLSQARFVAFEYISANPECERKVVEIYKNETGKFLSNIKDFPSMVQESAVTDVQSRAKAKHDDPKKCWTTTKKGNQEADLSDFRLIVGNPSWDECCSLLPTYSDKISVRNTKCRNGRGHWMCCEFFAGSDAHIRLPALHEPALRLRLNLQSILDIEQDGYLRPFDESTVLWPSGYLLALCVSNSVTCGIGDIFEDIMTSKAIRNPMAIEIGAGIGVASTALSLEIQSMHRSSDDVSSPSVVAADYAPQSLALTIANSVANNASVVAQKLDHLDLKSVRDLRTKYFPDDSAKRNGFSIVMGSSLKQMFLETENPHCELWDVVDELLDAKDPNAVAMFVHTRAEQLYAPSDSRFVLTNRISGDRFQMSTRAGASSDFDIFIFHRGAMPTEEL